MSLGILIAATGLAIVAMAAGALLTAPIIYRAGRLAERRRPAGRALPPRLPVRPTLRAELNFALALAVAHARADKPPRINPWAYRDHEIARDPALERLTRRPGEHRAPLEAVPA